VPLRLAAAAVAVAAVAVLVAAAAVDVVTARLQDQTGHEGAVASLARHYLAILQAVMQ
jgi:hypothetical protein